MDHERIKERIFESLDKELPEHEREEISMHLKSCKECSHEMDNWKLTSLMLSKISKPQDSNLFINSVMNKITAPHKEPVSLFKFNPWLIPTFAVSALVLVCIPLVTQKNTAISTAISTSTENLLLAELPDDVYNWAFSTSEPDLNLLFGSTTEEL